MSDLALEQRGAQARARAAERPWALALVRLGALWAMNLVLLRGDWLAMAGQWVNSSTYTHVLLVGPIIGWLVARRAQGLARLVPWCWWPGLVAFGLAALMWLVGTLAAVRLVSEAGAVALAMASVVLVMGPNVSRALAFPLAYMVFLVPFGDEFVPPLQIITARITVALVAASHVPASIDGVFIRTPAGLFEIAEACSGVKFLIAMLALGVLAANLCFASWRRRVVFVALCLVVAVLANGVRSWGTVYMAQIVGADRAGGIDHLIYGWVFFAVVIALVLALGWRWFDRPADAPAFDAARLAGPAPARAVPATALLAGAVLALVVTTGWARAADELAAPVPALVDLPEVAGWQRVDYAPRVAWWPRAAGADHRLLGRYADGKGHVVDVFFALYGAQGEGRKASGYGEGAITPGAGWAWQGPGEAPAGALGERLLARGGVARLAQTSWRNGELTTGSAAALRLATLREKLALAPQPTMMLILSAEEAPGHPAAASLAAFRAAIGPVGDWLDAVAQIG